MKIKIENGKEFANMLVFANGVLDEARMLIHNEGVTIREMDAAKVAMVIVDLQIEQPEVEEVVTLGLNLDELKLWMRKVKPKDALILDVNYPEIKFVIDGDYRRYIKYVSFEMDAEIPPIPELESKAVYDLPTKLLRDVIDSADIVGEHLEITGYDDSLNFKSGLDASEYGSKIEVDGDEVQNILTDNEEHIGKYTLAYLKDLVKPNMGEQVQLRFSNDMPISLVYRYDNATVTTFLAPRIEED